MKIRPVSTEKKSGANLWGAGMVKNFPFRRQFYIFFVDLARLMKSLKSIHYFHFLATVQILRQGMLETSALLLCAVVCNNIKAVLIFFISEVELFIS